MVWGGQRLGDDLGKPLPGPEPYGESWEVSDHVQHRSVVASGPFAGRNLRQLMEADRVNLLGKPASKYATFPWLVKFLDAKDWLSVQVHPDDEAVQRLWPGEGGKTEAWFILDAEPGSRIYAGLKSGVTEKDLRRALQEGTVADCLHQFDPVPGDCLFLMAGTVHAVGGGVLMAEVQQTSDATFRLYDWGRKDHQGRARELHLEQAMACIDWQCGPVDPIKTQAFGRDNSSKAGYHRQALVHCPFFSLEYVNSCEPFPLGGLEAMQVAIVVEGRGVIETRTGVEELTTGQTMLLPAAMPTSWCRPDPTLGILVSSLP
jgi:mannose-6-phosphate isomerase